MQQIKPTVLSHKIEILTAFIFSLAALFVSYEFLEANFVYWLFLPLYLVIIYLSRHNKFAYFASVLIPIIGTFSLYKLGYRADFYFNDEKFWAIYAIAAIALLSDKFPKDDETFLKNALNKISNLTLAFGVFVLLVIVVNVVVLGIDYFFDASLYRKNFWINFYVAIFIALTPFLFLLFEDKFYIKTSNALFRHILNFILTPTLIIYTAILYLYIANIALISGLPKGGTAIITLVYLISGFLLNALNDTLNLGSNNYKKTAKSLNFYKLFPYLAVAPIILLWIGILERINTYGLTPSRIYLIIAAILASLIYALMISKRLFSYRICALISVVAISITFFAIDIDRISLNSQISRLHLYLKELNLTSENGAIKKIDISNLSQEAKTKLTDIGYGIKRLDSAYSLQNNENLLDELTQYQYSQPKQVEEMTRYKTLTLGSVKIDLSGYKYMIIEDNSRYEDHEEQGFVGIFKDDEPIVLIDMNDHIKRVFEKRGLDLYNADYDYDVLNDLASDLLILHTKNGALVLRHLELMVNKKQGYRLSRATPAFFLQKE